MNTDSSQKEFLSDIAHELRASLSVIKMNTELALLDATLDPRLEKMLHSNEEEVDRITRTIHKLLGDTER